MIKYIILSAIIGGLLNRLRGGWLADAGYPLPKTVLKLVMSLFTTCCIYFPFWYIAGLEGNDYYWFVGAWIAAFGLGLAPGWGSWFHVGRDKTSYKHNSDWILSEWLAYLRYGPKWIPRQTPVKAKEELLKRFNLINSPDGNIRPYEWRRNMELFAMNIRGLNFAIAPCIFAAHMCFQYGLTLYWLAFVIPMTYTFGHMYEVGFSINFKKWPHWLKGTTHLGEVLSGASIMSSLTLAVVWIALLLT